MTRPTKTDLMHTLYGVPDAAPGKGGELIAAEEHVEAATRGGHGLLARLGMSAADKRLAERVGASNERVAGELVDARQDVALATIEAVRQDAMQRLANQASRAAVERERTLHAIHDTREEHARGNTLRRVDATQRFETAHGRRGAELEKAGNLDAMQRAVRDNCVQEIARSAVIGAMQVHQSGEEIRAAALLKAIEE